MDAQAESPAQGLSEAQAVELLKQRRAAGREQNAQQPVAKTEEAESKTAEMPSEEDAEVEGDGEAGGVIESQEEVAADPDEEPVINYVVDGKPQKASLKEAQEALASVKHLSRLRNEIVENHKQAQSTIQEVQTQRGELLTRLQDVEQLLMSGLPKPDEMQRYLDAGDTASYLKAQQAHQRFAEVRAYRQQQQLVSEQEQARLRAQREQTEAQELVKARPEFAKPEYAKKVLSFLTSEYGFSNDEVANLGARELQIVDDARKWNEWNRNKALGIKKAIDRSIQPSRQPTSEPVVKKEFSALRQQVREGGSMKDAIELVKLNKRLMKAT